MKILILCEGAAEKVAIDLLLDNNKLKITRDDLLGLTPYQARQLTNPTVNNELKNYNNEVIIYRVGDCQNDNFKIPLNLRHIVSKTRIFKYATKPEFEVLLLINEKIYDKYNNKIDPNELAKSNIRINKKKYDKSKAFVIKYYGNNVKSLVDNIIEYKRIKKHKKDELYLADLLK